jgi:hypothetical protein
MFETERSDSGSRHLIHSFIALGSGQVFGWLWWRHSQFVVSLCHCRVQCKKSEPPLSLIEVFDDRKTHCPSNYGSIDIRRKVHQTRRCRVLGDLNSYHQRG